MWLWLLTAECLLLFLLTGALYRLYFSPLAKFPGRKLAALTLWYEFYFDVVKRGRYTWEIQRMHQEYGPIIRISPYELHISDPDFYDELYTGPSNPRDKYEWAAKMFGNVTSGFGTVGHAHHRLRRAALNPYFSKQAISRLTPLILSKVERLCQRLEEFAGTGKPVKADDAYSALTMDIITEYCFAKPYGCLDHPEFMPEWPRGLIESSESSHLNKQFGWLMPLLMSLPEWFVAMASPSIMALLNFFKVLHIQMDEIMKNRGAVDPNKGHRTIFHEMLDSNLPPEEKTPDRLVDEGMNVVAAGTLTTAFYLKTTTYHILANPEVLDRLKAELTDAIPDPEDLPPLRELEALPYLHAVIQEGFRLSHGVTQRLPRVAPKEVIRYKEWKIPKGTPVGMTSIIIHENPDIFPDPKRYDPERWLKANEEKVNLDKYIVNFSRGTRSCLGIYLAQAEIHLTLAKLFRKFDFELYETDRTDADVAHDFFNPSSKLDSKGVRILVK